MAIGGFSMTLSSCRGVECDALIDDPVTLNVPQDKEATGFSRARQAIRAIRGGPVSACGTKEFSAEDDTGAGQAQDEPGVAAKAQSLRGLPALDAHTHHLMTRTRNHRSGAASSRRGGALIAGELDPGNRRRTGKATLARRRGAADGDFGRVRPRLRGGSMRIAAAALSQQLHEQPINRGLLMAALRGASS
jgi:hypothetical protein